MSTMKNINAEKLSEAQEKLLLAHMDGELGFFRGWYARRLITRSSAADRFMREARQLSQQTRSVLSQDRMELLGALKNFDLQARLEKRIAEEQRLRAPAGQRTPVAAGFGKWFEHFEYVAIGAAVSAATLLLGFNFWPARELPKQGYTFARVNPLYERAAAPVSFGGRQENPFAGTGFENIFNDLMATHAVKAKPVEVDWMRSRGRVKMVQHPEQRAMILWVNRQHSPFYGASSSYSNGRTAGGVPIEVLDDNVPAAVSVVNR